MNEYNKTETNTNTETSIGRGKEKAQEELGPDQAGITKSD